jgi:hypothetical protein
MAKAFAFPIMLGGLVLGACAGDEAIGAPEAAPCQTGSDCVPLEREPGGLDIENRTGVSVEIHVGERDGVRVDRRVVDGSLSLPIPVVTAAFERTLFFEAERRMTFINQVSVIDGKEALDHFGAFVRVGDDPAVLALGFGRLLVRMSEDGSPVIEAEDPKAVSLSPASRSVSECAEGVLSVPFPPPPASFFDAARRRVGAQHLRSVVRGADGCRDLDIADDNGDAVANVHVCLPDAAYPFSEGEDVRVFATGEPTLGPTTTTLRFAGASGADLTLTRVLFGGRTSTDAERLELTLDPQDSCARVDPRCGHVDVPARMSARTSDGAIQRVVYGQPIVDTEGPRTFFVLAGSARPVAATECTGDDDPGAMAPGRAWVATVIPAAK